MSNLEQKDEMEDIDMGLEISDDIRPYLQQKAQNQKQKKKNILRLIFVVFIFIILVITFFITKKKKRIQINEEAQKFYISTHNNDTLYNAQIKASHNSYQRGPLIDQLIYNKTAPHEGGCKSIELDLMRNINTYKEDQDWEFIITHGSQLEEEGPTISLNKILEDLKKFNLENPNSDLITVILDLKGEEFDNRATRYERDSKLIEQALNLYKGDLYELSQITEQDKQLFNQNQDYEGQQELSQQLEKFSQELKFLEGLQESTQNFPKNYRDFAQEKIKNIDPELYARKINTLIEQHFGSENLYTPQDMIRGFNNLRESIKFSGYESMEKLKGKFQFIISGADVFPVVKQVRDLYSQQDIKTQLCFVDIDGRMFNLYKENKTKKEIMQDFEQEILEYSKMFPNKFIFNTSISHRSNFSCPVARKLGFLTRVYTAKNEIQWKKSENVQATFIATDGVYNSTWALAKQFPYEYAERNPMAIAQGLL